MRLQVSLKGLNKLEENFKKLNRNVKEELARELQDIGLEIEAKAKEYVPVNLGQLRAQIRVRFLASKLVGAVAVDSAYAPFVEFGTGPLGRSQWTGPLPDGYRHSSSRKRPPIDMILKWVQQKGLTMSGIAANRRSRKVRDEQRTLAYLIARKIGKVGTAPHPFLTRAFYEVEKTAGGRIKAAVKRGLHI